MASDRKVKPEKLAAVNGGLDGNSWGQVGGDGITSDDGHWAPAYMDLLFDPGSDACTLKHIINKCAQPVEPSQFSTVDDADVSVGGSLFAPRVVTDDAVIQKMQKCVDEAMDEPCQEGAKNCKPCGKYPNRFSDQTSVTQDAGADQLLKCYSEKGEARDKCFASIPYTARLVGHDRFGLEFYASPEDVGMFSNSTPRHRRGMTMGDHNRHLPS